MSFKKKVASGILAHCCLIKCCKLCIRETCDLLVVVLVALHFCGEMFLGLAWKHAEGFPRTVYLVLLTLITSGPASPRSHPWREACSICCGAEDTEMQCHSASAQSHMGTECWERASSGINTSKYEIETN